jgi:hypothetical protein
MIQHDFVFQVGSMALRYCLYGSRLIDMVGLTAGAGTAVPATSQLREKTAALAAQSADT